ncbi:YigZ family protein [Dehalobacter sp. DCM]|uniref:IMPACT family protein n=1 Tax=Dehalobacter sp. DCM TaxID=2907827 RepID=UPI0030818FBC|nr:YigZ family protein [Dehalobacter sp. DCM]
MDSFYTVAQEASEEQIIEKSRFIGLVKRIENTAQAEQNLKETRESLPNARHYVYAYRIHASKLEKSSDDGEPQGTGGKPVLDLLQHRQIWNVQIIVVRYFGGILLGTGGLTRAYAGTARVALEKAGRTLLIPHQIYSLKIPYSWYEQIKYGLRQHGWESANEQFMEYISLDVFIQYEEQDHFVAWLDEHTNKQVLWKPEGFTLKTSAIIS